MELLHDDPDKASSKYVPLINPKRSATSKAGKITPQLIKAGVTNLIKQEKIRGYKVKVRYRALSGVEQDQQNQAISRIVAGAIRRKNRTHGHAHSAKSVQTSKESKRSPMGLLE